MKQVLAAMQSKGYLEEQTVSQIEDVIRDRGTNENDLDPVSPGEDVEMSENTPADAQKPNRSRDATKLDKRHIQQRIEEDRERHKRERESIWAVSDPDAERDKLWDETSDFGEDDDRLVTEEGEEFATEMEMQKCDHLKSANGSSNGP